MARHGRGFPLGTSYRATWRTVPTDPLAGTATFVMTAQGTLVVVPGVVTPGPDEAQLGQHRFRAPIVPSIANFDEVQRHLQRAVDEVAMAVNPLRSVRDGGTGLNEVTAGAFMVGTGESAMETVPIGAAGSVLESDGSMPGWRVQATLRTSANQALTGQALVTVTGLSFTGVANKDYLLEGFILYRSSLLTNGLALGITCPASPADISYSVATPERADAINAAWHGWGTASGDIVSAPNTPIIDTTFLALVTGIVRVGATGGTIAIAAANDKATNNLTVRAGSTLRYRQLN